jgi:hypothetical protein
METQVAKIQDTIILKTRVSYFQLPLWWLGGGQNTVNVTGQDLFSASRTLRQL